MRHKGRRLVYVNCKNVIRSHDCSFRAAGNSDSLGDVAILIGRFELCLDILKLIFISDIFNSSFYTSWLTVYKGRSVTDIACY
jgi:hypothetical protein